jgi:hypothetical protein
VVIVDTAGFGNRAAAVAMTSADVVLVPALSGDTSAQRAARNRAIAAARIQLGVDTNRRLNPAAVSRVDSLLGLPASDPALGVQ